jgi:hypothetical protein
MVVSNTDKCPQCGGDLERDEADVGVGVIYGPAGCPACYWTEGSPIDPDFMKKLLAPPKEKDG